MEMNKDMRYRIKKCVIGVFDTNVYFVTDEETGKSAVIDPAYFSKELEDEVSALGPENIEYILLTHRHFDHIMGVYDLKKLTGAKVVISENDAVALTDENESQAFDIMPGEQKYLEADIRVKDGDEIKLGRLTFKFVSTPGHTVGSCCIFMDNVIFSGDMLFKGTVGRTDLKTGSYSQIIESAKKLAVLESDYRVLPGHGEETTLDFEKKYNPYLES